MAYDDIITPGQTLDSAWWMRAAQAAVRAYCGWHVCPRVSETITLGAYGGHTLELPTAYIVTLDSVVVDTREVVSDVSWAPTGTLVMRHSVWPDLPGSVKVTLTHGWDPDEVPDVAAIIMTVAKRAKSNPANISSQSVNGASVSYTTSGGAPLAIPLLRAEMDALYPYRCSVMP